ncbi:MAG: MmgE/PrpD family protein [Pseudomonadales bacterium]|nr:MmgE/PrpD family protein [Pseudomonadales bacterium]
MIADELWQQFGRLKYDDIPESTRTVARQSILDWMGCVIAGGAEPLANILREEFGTADGPCSIFGTDIKTQPQMAALINGATGHALDFDDTNMAMGGHSTVPVLPAVWAMAEALGVSGEALITAFVVGTEIECRLGCLIGGAHYGRGWHVTSTLGVFGAAAAVSHLLGLDNEKFGNAFGLAASQASGLKANFGTMTKPFHAGHAAERGLIAARLASRGFTANPAAFEASQGLTEAASRGTLNLKKYDKLKHQWLTEHTLFKYHAACYLTHAAIEALKSLDAVDVEACRAIDLFVHPSLMTVCGIEDPQTGLEAKFSLRANAALALLDYDTTDPAVYDLVNVNNPQVQRLLKRVKVNLDDDIATTQTKAVIHYPQQQSQQAFYDTGIPAVDLQAQQKKLAAKFYNLTKPVLASGAEKLQQQIVQIDATETLQGWF